MKRGVGAPAAAAAGGGGGDVVALLMVLSWPSLWGASALLTVVGLFVGGAGIGANTVISESFPVRRYSK